jgi:transposase
MKVFTHEYAVLTDPVLGRFIDLLPNCNLETVVEALLKIPDRHKIEVVSIDFDTVFYAGIRRTLPGADIVNDRRHAQAMVTRALREFLKELHEKKGDE